MINFDKEKKILNNIAKEKKEYLDLIFEQKIFPKDIFKKIEQVNSSINTKMNEIISQETIDYKAISSFINKLIMEKVYFNNLISSTNYLKWKFEVVKANSKLKTITDSYTDWEIKLKGSTSDHVSIKLDSLNAYYNIIQDIIIKIRNTKDVIDSTIMALQSQLKNVTFEYINSWVISK